MVVIPIWQLNSWILPSRTYQKSAVGMSSLAPVGWITPAGVSNGPRKVLLVDLLTMQGPGRGSGALSTVRLEPQRVSLLWVKRSLFGAFPIMTAGMNWRSSTPSAIYRPVQKYSVSDLR